MPKFITRNQFLHVEDAEKKCLDCPVCEYGLRDADDQKSYDEKGACTECIDRFYYPNLDQWEAGWRPAKNDVFSPPKAIIRRKVGVKYARTT